ncbi:butyrophilin subfamily 3 member A3-like isoform X2 [Stegastes partitus]|uniref:Butyrophilin subfamily 3 member A3-like n=1 Tax=Stegastes partitus TaxID=144197 RepID=A0A3B5BCU3_9TELE|nr:PREDICTED: butyrophilin subfamily 3 member A3-like isoform X2 [Stegastes partitus]
MLNFSVVLVSLLFACRWLEAAVFPGSAGIKPTKIIAIVGETVVLPCSIFLSDELPTVEWSKEGLSPNITFLYRDGCETFEMKHPDFEFRTNLLMNELKHGNISLRISNLQLSDGGKYQCVVLQKKERKVVSTLELVVGAVPEPTLSVVSDEDGGATLQCEVKHCWPSQPLITFLDEQGQEIDAEKPRTAPRSGECFNVTRRATATNSVTCRVHHSEINKTRDTKMYIPENCMKRWTQAVKTVVITMFALIAVGLVIAAVLLYMRCRRGKKQKVSEPPRSNGRYTASRAAGANRQGNQAETLTYEELLRANRELKSKIQEKDRIIRRQADELKGLKSRQNPVSQNSPSIADSTSSPDVSNLVSQPPRGTDQDSNPKPAASTTLNSPKSDKSATRSKDRNPVASRQSPPPGPPTKTSTHDSCPSLPTSSAAAPSTSEEKHRIRSRSLSEPRPRPSGAKTVRRNTTSITSSNRYTVLEDLHEDLEPLI